MSKKSPTTMRCRQLVRTLEVLQMLQGRPSTLAELTAAVGEGAVTTRTIRRDLEALQLAGFSIYDDDVDDGRRRYALLTKGLTPARQAA